MPTSPGVQFRGDALVFGNSIRPGLSMSTDSGIFFDIVETNPRWFRGTWVDGRSIEPLPHGYFCAWRIGG